MKFLVSVLNKVICWFVFSTLQVLLFLFESGYLCYVCYFVFLKCNWVSEAMAYRSYSLYHSSSNRWRCTPSVSKHLCSVYSVFDMPLVLKINVFSLINKEEFDSQNVCLFFFFLIQTSLCWESIESAWEDKWSCRWLCQGMYCSSWRVWDPSGRSLDQNAAVSWLEKSLSKVCFYL